MDKYFKRMSIIDMTATKIKGYIEYARREGYAGPTIRRQLGRLRKAFNLAKAHDLINDSHIPTFSLPKDSAAREGFLDVPDFMKLRDAMPEHLQPAVTFLYYTGFRSGAAAKITWDMVSKDNTEIHVSSKITKNKKAIIIPLVGPLTPIAEDLARLRKFSPKPADRVLCFRNFRFTWNATCGRLGLGTFNTKTRTYSGLKPHDFRRSAARNLIKAGVDRRTAMKITGHKTEHIFERYNIKTTDDVKEALIKVGAFSTNANNVAELAASR
jgi:integrase